MDSIFNAKGSKVLTMALILAASIIPGYMFFYNYNTDLFFKITDLKVILFSIYYSLQFFAPTLALNSYMINTTKAFDGSDEKGESMFLTGSFVCLLAFIYAYSFHRYSHIYLLVIYYISVIITLTLIGILLKYKSNKNNSH